MASKAKHLVLVWDSLRWDLLTNPLVSIGRGMSNDVQIPDPLVSSNHAEIKHGALVDKGSTNGTFVNDVPVAEGKRTQLAAGDRIRLGDTVVRVEAGNENSSISAQSVRPHGAGAATYEGSSSDDDDEEEEEEEEEEEAGAENGGGGAGGSDSSSEEDEEAAAAAAARTLAGKASPHPVWGAGAPAPPSRQRSGTIRPGAGGGLSREELITEAERAKAELRRVQKELRQVQHRATTERRRATQPLQRRVHELEYQVHYGTEVDERYRYDYETLKPQHDELKARYEEAVGALGERTEQLDEARLRLNHAAIRLEALQEDLAAAKGEQRDALESAADRLVDGSRQVNAKIDRMADAMSGLSRAVLLVLGCVVFFFLLGVLVFPGAGGGGGGSGWYPRPL